MQGSLEVALLPPAYRFLVRVHSPVSLSDHTLFEFRDSPGQVGGLERPPGALQQLRHGRGFRGCQIPAGKSLHHPDEAGGDVAGRLCFLCMIGFSLVACIVYSLSLMPGDSSGGLSLAASPAKTGE